jgi:hypothetical protein
MQAMYELIRTAHCRSREGESCIWHTVSPPQYPKVSARSFESSEFIIITQRHKNKIKQSLSIKASLLKVQFFHLVELVLFRHLIDNFFARIQLHHSLLDAIFLDGIVSGFEAILHAAFQLKKRERGTEKREEGRHVTMTMTSHGMHGAPHRANTSSQLSA